MARPAGTAPCPHGNARGAGDRPGARWLSDSPLPTYRYAASAAARRPALPPSLPLRRDNPPFAALRDSAFRFVPAYWSRGCTVPDCGNAPSYPRSFEYHSEVAIVHGARKPSIDKLATIQRVGPNWRYERHDFL